MSELMRGIPFENIITWSLDEYKKMGSVFGIRKDKFYFNKSGKKQKIVLGDEISTIVGPAAGPNSQLAQNIIASYLSGARFMELKTVQKMDGKELQDCIARPCIYAEDECYNCEWSTELTVLMAYEEYIKAYFACIVLAKEFGISDSQDFAYNMSVGYDLEGIKLPKIDNYIENMKDASKTEIFNECKNFLKENISMFSKFTLEDLEKISPNICNSVTLSTLHGCPAEDIEKISYYLLTEKKVNAFIKCNPTLLGYEFARSMLDKMGYDYIAFDDHHFNNDLQYADAIAMFRRLLKVAENEGKAFGLKITNTFPVQVKKGELPSEEMYMAGRSLYLLSLSLASKLSTEFKGQLPMAYSGGADAFNIREIFETGVMPITVATTILKPSGYERFRQLAEETEDLMKDKYEGIDYEKLAKVVANIPNERRNHKLYREKAGNRKTDSELPLFDCYKAPCKDGGCPIEQQIPEYLKLVADKNYDKAIEVIANDNTAPTILGVLCAHHCQDRCTRVDYEKTLQIRDMKLIAADNAQDKFISNIKKVDLKTQNKVAVIGAGPVGIAVASYLRRNGVAVTVFEKLSKPYGIVSHIIPEFRISNEQIERDYQMAVNQGVEFRFNTEVKDSYENLQKEYKYVVVCTGAWEKGLSPVKEGADKIIDALEFLGEYKNSGKVAKAGKKIAVVGAGDVAMDCVRVASRLEGVEKAVLVYRRTEAYMPAAQEEVDHIKKEGIEIMELTAPVSFDGKTFRCEKMTLGDFDESGRKSVVGTGEILDLDFDTVVGATGARVDVSAFAQNKLSVDKKGYAVLSATNETSKKDVYVAGDCKSGPSTIVKGMGDAKKIALDIMSKENIKADFVKFDIVEDENELYKRRAILVLPQVGGKEGERCLKCDQICEICVQVCPNRANVMVEVDGYELDHQIVHIDGMCNECGNCEVFCPHAGRPYKDKFTVFWTLYDFEESTNEGFYKKPDGTYLFRVGKDVVEYKKGGDNIPKQYINMLEQLEEKYPYYVIENIVERPFV